TSEVIQNFPQPEVVKMLDDIKDLGFDYSTRSGISWGMNDIIVPEEKPKIIVGAMKEVEKIREHYMHGLLTLEERKSKSISVWHKTKEQIAKLVPPTMHKANPVFMIFDSGSRGNISQLTQMAGMKGVVINPAGATIELPIIPSFKEGFNVLEYFISTHGARKGTTDTALKTAAAGYLTRRLVDVAQDVVVREHDCGDTEGVIKYKEDGDEIKMSLGERALGRAVAEDIKDTNGKVMVKKGELVNRDQAKAIDDSGIKKMKLRSVMRCKSIKGICARCFGYDLGSNSLVKMGEAVGIVTAQAIGEPGTQLTMRTFHIGGVAGVSDITQGLPRVEEVFEVRPPKGQAIISEFDGKVEEVISQGNQKLIKIRVETKSGKDNIKEYSLPVGVSVFVEKGDLIAKGSQISEGNLNLQDLFAFAGQEAVERYIVKEVETIYVTQGASINEKYLEVIARQMLSRVRITDPGDTKLLPGEVSEKWQVWSENAKLDKKGKKATYEQLLLGITKVSLTTESFLSAASFQETARSLINAAIEAKEDGLRGLKENVIVGRLIPAGTGFRE
ncbi:MAG: DNA-directed RNA polymerase subunit beta', partial [bacterium]|nr:DNA-directed RNA polymerase subunit beta' [bacterium]